VLLYRFWGSGSWLLEHLHLIVQKLGSFDIHPIFLERCEADLFEHRFCAEGGFNVDPIKPELEASIDRMLNQGGHYAPPLVVRMNIGAINVTVGIQLKESCDFLANNKDERAFEFAAFLPVLGIGNRI